MIVCFVDIGGIVDHHCLQVIVCFVDIGGVVDHHSLEVIVCFASFGFILRGAKTLTTAQISKYSEKYYSSYHTT